MAMMESSAFHHLDPALIAVLMIAFRGVTTLTEKCGRLMVAAVTSRPGHVSCI